MWVIPIAVRLHNLYMETALLCAGLLEEKKEYGAMESLAARAIRVDPLDERISCALLRALIRQGKDTAALSQYENTTELLYRSLGVRPSEELQAVYREIMASQQALETDLEIIQGQLRETARRTGFTPHFFNLDQFEEAKDCLQHCEVLYAHSADLLRAAPATLKWYCCSFAGVDLYCKDPGLFANPDCLLTNSNVYGVTIAEHVVMVTLMLLRRMPELSLIHI